MNTEAVQLYRQKVLIAKAKCDTAEQFAMLLAIISVGVSYMQFHTWPAGLALAVFTYWVSTVSYKSDLKKATNDYMTVTGYKPDFI